MSLTVNAMVTIQSIIKIDKINLKTNELLLLIICAIPVDYSIQLDKIISLVATLFASVNSFGDQNKNR